MVTRSPRLQRLLNPALAPQLLDRAAGVWNEPRDKRAGFVVAPLEAAATCSCDTRDNPAGLVGAVDVAAKLAATDATPLPRIEIVEERRRSHDASFRARVVSEAMAPGARVQELARRHGICTSLIYRWRRGARGLALASPAVKLVPVRVAEPAKPEPNAAARPTRDSKRPGVIEIALDGGARIRVAQ